MKLHEQIKAKNKPGQGRKKGEESITPSLRCKKSDWLKLKEKYPRGINKLFNEFVTTLLHN